MNILELMPTIKSIQAKYGITDSDTWIQQSNGTYKGMKTDKIIDSKAYKDMCQELNNLFRKYL